MNLLKYLFHKPTWQKLPMIPRSYSSVWDESEVDHDTAILMEVTQTRCPQGVEILVRKHKKTARELSQTLKPRKHKRKPLGRIEYMVRSTFGLMQYDPMKSIARRHIRKERETR